MPDDSMDWISAAPSTGKSCEVLHGIGRPEPDDVAFVLFTSGSTGVPRGVRLSHRNFDQYLETVAETIHPLAYERSAWTSSVAFDSSAAEVLYPVVMGGTIVVLDRADLASAASLTQAFRSRAISGFGCATALWSAWMKHVARIDQPIPETLRHVDIGGSVADPDLIRNWLDLTDASICLMNRYGPTETTVTVTAHTIDATSIDHDSIPIGRPERGTEIRILDEAERRVPPGVEGEIWIGGGQVALGYMPIDQDQGGFRTLAGAEGRWFRTGDRGSWTPDGEILFGGRNDDQVKIAGYRIELNEVRQAINRIEERREIDVLAIGVGTDRILGVVVETGSMEIETDAWIIDMEALRSFVDEASVEELQGMQQQIQDMVREQAEQAAPPAARRGAERDRGIAFVRAAATDDRQQLWARIAVDAVGPCGFAFADPSHSRLTKLCVAPRARRSGAPPRPVGRRWSRPGCGPRSPGSEPYATRLTCRCFAL